MKVIDGFPIQIAQCRAQLLDQSCLMVLIELITRRDAFGQARRPFDTHQRHATDDEGPEREVQVHDHVVVDGQLAKGCEIDLLHIAASLCSQQLAA